MTARGAADVEVHARDEDRLGDVLAPLLAASGSPPAPVFAGATAVPPETTLADGRLRHGAVLGLGNPAGCARSGNRGALELRVVGGPDAGRTTALDRGDHVIGRGGEAVVVLDDPDVSRRHAVVRVRDGGVHLLDLGSRNGTTVDGADVAYREEWRPGERARLGASTLEVTWPDDRPATVVGCAGGRTLLRPSAGAPAASPVVEVAFPPRPAETPPRRLAWVAVALPAVGGIVLATVLRAPGFLFFALLSPLVAVASWWSDRRSGRRTHRRELLDFERRTAEAQARLDDAVGSAVRAQHRRLPDLAALASAARRRTALLWSRLPGHPDQLVVRVGTGPGITPGVRRADPGSAPVDVRAEDVPVPVDLRATGLTVVAPRARALGVVRGAVVQLAVLHPPDVLELVLVTTAGRLADWRWTRWLPHQRSRPVLVPESGPARGTPEGLTGLLASIERRRALRPTSGPAWTGPWTTVVVDGPLPVPVATALSSAGDVGLTVLTCAPTVGEVSTLTGTTLTATGELGTHAELGSASAGTRDGFVVDQLPADLAAELARDLAAVTSTAQRSALPIGVRLLDLVTDEVDVRERAPGAVLPGPWSRDRRSLSVPLGVGADGVERIDLCRQGPHALVAGTTGAGKSELLQTLVAGLAAAHPPDRCSFLLVDYKGGAAFAEAAELPHTVGMLTDLDDAATARALRSLSAELTRREALLSAHSVADIAELPEEVPLARLVIVVDEFATLAEELPSFVPGLVGVAQRGRSLGIHLVLATQRPAGVVSADIRANCTLRVCLRTTDQADSRDVLGTPDAADLPVEVPGRAYLRSGTGAPRLLQVARVSQPPPAEDAAAVVTPWCWPALSPTPVAAGPDGSDLADLVRAARVRADRQRTALPHRPWRPPLPASLTVDDARALTGEAERLPGRLLLGVLDRPERQAQEALLLDLDEGGGWLVVGGPRSGRTTVLHNVLSQAVADRTPDRLHVHVLDHGGALAAVAEPLRAAGTVVTGDDALRSVRLVHRLAEEVARRRAALRADDPHLLLLVDGVEAVCALIDDADPARGSAELLRLVRDGAGVGLTTVLTADRAVPGGRLAGVARHRLVLPLPDRADYAVAGVPLAAVPSTRPPGRALVGEDAVECQLVLPRPVAEAAGSGADPHRPPLRIVQLDADPLLVGGPDPATGSAGALRVAVGPGGDEGRPQAVDLARSGGLLVVGPPGSGRTSTLQALEGDLVAASVPVLRLHGPFDGPSPRAAVDTAEVTDAAATAAWLEARSGAPAAVLVDDLGPAGSAPALGALPQLGAAGGVVLVATTSAADLSTWFQGPVAALRRARSGLLLCPGPGDADVLGVRLPRTPVPVRPGSGWLVRAGSAERVQVARRRAAPWGQSSSSTGPISCVAYQASS